MKFGRYLEENLTPEWRRAYIDYKGCKKRIKAVDQRLRNRDQAGSIGGNAEAGPSRRKEGGDEGGSGDSSDNDLDHGPAAPPRKRSASVKASPAAGSGRGAKGSPLSATATANRETIGRTPAASTPNYGSTTLSPRSIQRSGTNNPINPTNPPPLDIGEPSFSQSASIPAPKSRLNTVAFASQPQENESAGVLSKSPEEADYGDGASPGQSPPGRQRVQSGESAISGLSGATDTPLTKGADEAEGGALSRQLSRVRSWRSPRMSTGGRAEPSLNTNSPRVGARSIRSMTLPSPFLPARTAATFSDLYDTLDTDEQDFFDFLERELQKVDSFYLARQEEAVRRGKDLQQQLTELAEHRRLYHEVYPELPKWESAVERFVPGVTPEAARATVTGVTNAAHKLQQRLPNGLLGKTGEGNGPVHGDGGEGGTRPHSRGPSEALSERDKKQFSTDRYTKYKHELRKATLEYYRHLEIIKNYRILNVTGFRKALKKFEKTTRIHCLESFTEERISPEAFAKGEVVDKMLKQVEEMFTEHFEHGDTKKARERLRKQDYVATHYTSVFRSGVMLGVGIPTAIISIVQALRLQAAEPIDSWIALLQVYAGLFLPVIFALLFELNLDAFVSTRINYEFVMELSRPVLDFRSYMEIPAFLFLTLSVCMYFSILPNRSRECAPYIVNSAPHDWPAAWLVFVALFFINPLPMVRRRARYWLLRVLWRVITPGWSRVEFIAFFVADELNSLAYSISNILFMSCAYANGWPDNLYSICRSGAEWPYILVLAAPAIIRLIQCVKRYLDSALKIHLINAGKYAASICQYGMFVWWRIRGSRIPDGVFVAWVIVASLSAAYNTAWDYVVDWSLLRPGTQGLRKDRGYSSRNVYYFAMVTNLLIRFVFVWYIPARASHVRVRSFFFALLEMLRRWQWNFFRVETEHLGNADAYRVTREIPLPYRRLDPDSEEEAELEKHNHSIAQRWSKLKAHLLDTSRPGRGRGPDALAIGARGRRAAREYEARRPGDEPETPHDEVPGCGGGEGGWDGLLRRIRRMKSEQANGSDERV